MTEEEVHLAYRKLKSLVYFDKTDLRLRSRLAAFECGKDFDKRLADVREIANADRPSSDLKFLSLLKDVGYRLVPKKLKPGPQELSDAQPNKGRFITNVTTASAIDVDRVNFFFDGPVELHLIAVLWIMLEGRHLDRALGDECCGSRLSDHLQDEKHDSLALFTKYHEQYARWRDTGIRKAKQLLVDERRNVAILGLDVQEYYYRVKIDFDEVNSTIEKAGGNLSTSENYPLLRCIQAIGESYRLCIAPMLSRTHPDIGDDVVGLPIGLCSSLVLANWYLQGFDSAVMKKVRPAYYGRYVDDILLVVPLPDDPSVDNENPVAAFIESLLVSTRVLRHSGEGAYEICARPGLLLQQSKCILQYFDARHSIAGLEKFQKKLEQNGSDFLLLPVDEADNSMEDVAYELLYEGSTNKFRSVKGVSENRYELAKHLARQTILHLMIDESPDRKVSRGLQKFFKGRSAIEYFDLWERVLTLLGIANDRATLNTFSKQLRAEIARVRTADVAVTKQLIADLKMHLELSLAMADAVSAEDIGLSEFVDEIHSESLRRANLLRHHFVRRPLLNFTTYKGPLSDRATKLSVKIDQRKVKYSPRFVNFDECMLLVYSGVLRRGTKTAFEEASIIFEAINRQPVVGVDWSRSASIEE
ncbi:RNA-directed DNA polymerase [Metapseudomonas furukawaii]|uniref:RNA-directed DNA polymerase n=1 Tax=Metapseudomonas furukawaii TaxID=1149133 RepID=UPI00227CC644|nr:RNA-directed DNA polymerase [Pseudomonas furukawaii]WAG81359.1 RNA-directed DNA polymerase [Pseudomonas furukawaii]